MLVLALAEKRSHIGACYTCRMYHLPISVPVVIAALTIFLSVATALGYAVRSYFVRTRLIMTLFFFFIVTTLSVSFWNYAMATLPFSAPAALLGALVGHIVGVQTEREKLAMQGLEHYMEHFAHVHMYDIKSLTWWSFINFYSIMGGLLLINLVGLSNVIFRGAENWAIATSTVGAFLIGTIIPYLLHLWSIPATKRR
jgi:small-conductance mechanosensitive channel